MGTKWGYGCLKIYLSYRMGIWDVDPKYAGVGFHHYTHSLNEQTNPHPIYLQVPEF